MKPLQVLWLQGGGCGGCTMSLLNADTADFARHLEAVGVRWLSHPALSLGDRALPALLADCLAGRVALDLLVLEGAVLRGPRGSGAFHRLAGDGRPMAEWLRALAGVATHVAAVGSCAAFGGIAAVQPDVTEACGLQFEDERKGGLLGADFVARGGLPVINIAGCPPHPGWVLDTFAALAAARLPPEGLDGLGRPRFYADHLVHHGCSRNEYYEFKASAAHPTELGCLMENLGCQGTQAHADCNLRLWNGNGSCLRGGYACVGCTEPGFQDPGHPFDRTPKLAGIPIGLPTDMPKAWFVALASLSKSATPRRVKVNAGSDHVAVPPAIRKTRLR
ncbi:MAG TPA: HupU protein [Burkholderiaceae bacterium]|nr:HupU protein [Burkholderiaceae bacterium]